ncbi:uncharacterized protein ATNIH1004_004106 [Aspergillus tanneri]|uniref:Uncharacterized protein n=1 Tax=Aspergillus tanneri TaxID=1220188 RepID=A0A5M9MTK9_9EURO|nr:uncharacterized protein ATNIH1004_004106 [Aspergillus tanneri]KAA8648223.1 hypothetical protein ATNIH1004_004106 [Aspergillus tanneri]
MNDADHLPKNIPPYTPMSSLGHELGILFGFLAACFVVIAVYIVLWREGKTVIERREEQRERLRKEQLTAKGIHHGRGGVHEKMMDRDRIAPFERVELPGGQYPHSSGDVGIGVGGSSRANVTMRNLERRLEREMEMEILGVGSR